MGKIAVIADLDTVCYFKLTGVKECHVANNAEEARYILGKLIQTPGISLIMITESLSTQISDYIEKITRTKKEPLIVSIADRSRRVKTEITPISQLIRKVMGVKLGAE